MRRSVCGVRDVFHHNRSKLFPVNVKIDNLVMGAIDPNRGHEAIMQCSEAMTTVGTSSAVVIVPSANALLARSHPFPPARMRIAVHPQRILHSEGVPGLPILGIDARLQRGDANASVRVQLEIAKAPAVILRVINRAF